MFLLEADLAVMLLLALDAPVHSGDLGWLTVNPALVVNTPDLLRDSQAFSAPPRYA